MLKRHRGQWVIVFGTFSDEYTVIVYEDDRLNGKMLVPTVELY